MENERIYKLVDEQLKEMEEHKQRIYEKLSVLYEKRQRKVGFIKNNGEKCVERIGKTASGDFIIMIKGSTHRGHDINYKEYADVVELPSVPIDKVWGRQLAKAISMLEESGLWTDMKNEMKIALQVGYKNLHSILDVDLPLNNPIGTPNSVLLEQEIERARAIDPRLISIKSSGKEYLNDIVYRYSYPLKIKAMNFGYDNQRKLAQLKEAIAKKQAITLTGRSSYDVSLTYDPVNNQAVYAEEFKNTGNGHYYLALSATHAMFYEDD